jgi:glycosyltransferase involved in cell wall biosynthesis
MIEKKIISLLIPAYNEELVLPLLYERISKVIEQHSNYSWEILFVNDGSSDGTLNIFKQLSKEDDRVQYLDLSRNFGKESAMMAGFDYVTGDGVVILDADLQHPPEVITELIEYWEQGYDDIAAKRKSPTGESFLKKAFSKIFFSLLSRITKIPIQKNIGDFRLLDRKCINAIRELRENQRYTKGLYAWIGFKKKTILFTQGERAAGKTKWSYFQLINLAIVGITSFTISPLRFSTIFGIIVSLFSFIYGVGAFVKESFFDEEIQGDTSLMIAILFLGGVQLLSIGILGEYLGRVFNETKKRPSYLIRESSFNDNNQDKQNQ